MEPVQGRTLRALAVIWTVQGWEAKWRSCSVTWKSALACRPVKRRASLFRVAAD
jgi:hypothetical protein